MKGLPADLKTLLVAPHMAGGWSAERWSRVAYLAQAAGVLTRISVDLTEAGKRTGLPQGLEGCLLSAERNGARNQVRLSWEMDRIKRVFWDRDIKIVLLKGAAYLAGDIPCTRGRLSSDMDILVAKDELAGVEATLLDAGWVSAKEIQGDAEDYDDLYYRRWMHELPPLVHEGRGTVIDVHHTILPPTGRVTADGSELLELAVPVESLAATEVEAANDPAERSRQGYYVLCDTDMLLHSTVHLFQDGEIRGGLRDLVDQRDMIAHFADRPGFWDRLIARAEYLGLGRPLFYSLRYAEALLDAPVPEPALKASQRFAPPLPVRLLMDLLVPRALTPTYLFDSNRVVNFAGELLYMRSHWLRMPPVMLARHLAIKAWRRAGGTKTA
ncbi:nucleotidyltransferase family protein [Pelagibius sp. Alg239-R121]|uniref:nucleotidyltransferase domain-containing protein n=1 Tax=Pelagibius sp. Alg239-R121 TaxID=2993448 RepID=UPI0024A61735|nr:nucleotidyltransferase family protein [Pelagibius sp. Alg239-R121]